MPRHMCEAITNAQAVKCLIARNEVVKLGGINFKIETRGLIDDPSFDVSHFLSAKPVNASEHCSVHAGIDFGYYVQEDDAYYYVFSSMLVQTKSAQAMIDKLSASYKDDLICNAIRVCASELHDFDGARYLRITHSRGTVEIYNNRTLRLRNVSLESLVVDGSISAKALKPYIKSLMRRSKRG